MNMVKAVQWDEPLTQDEQQLHILLVEDSPVQQTLLAQFVRQLGHKVTVASNGLEAISAIRKDSCYSVILMDCEVPLMDGFQCTRLIREMAQPTDQKITIIGISSTASAEECFSAGMNDFLCKPFDRPLLAATLKRWVKVRH